MGHTEGRFVEVCYTTVVTPLPDSMERPLIVAWLGTHTIPDSCVLALGFRYSASMTGLSAATASIPTTRATVITTVLPTTNHVGADKDHFNCNTASSL